MSQINAAFEEMGGRDALIRAEKELAERAAAAVNSVFNDVIADEQRCVYDISYLCQRVLQIRL
jgi:hypothetical protein